MFGSAQPSVRTIAPEKKRAFRADWSFLVPLIIVLVVVYQTLIPLLVMLAASLGLVMPSGPMGPTLRGYLDAYSDVRTWTTFLNSFQFALGAGGLAVVVGILLGWIVHRTDIPFKTILFGMAVVPIMLPGLVTATGWVVLLGPNAGWINQLYRAVTGQTGPLFNISSMPGMIVVEAIHLTPFAFVLVGAAFQSMDSALEEAGAASGANPIQVFRRVTLPLLMPALVGTILICLVRALEAFEVPVIVGAPAKIYLLTSEIYYALRKFPADYTYGASIGMGLLALTAFGIWLHSRVIAEGRRYQTLTGKGFRPEMIRLGRWRQFALALVGLYFFLSVGLPLLTLFLLSLQPFTRMPTMQSLTSISLANYAIIFSPLTIKTATNSLLLGLMAATVVSLLSAVIAWIVTKSRMPMRSLLDFLAFVPIGIPGIIVGISFIFLYLTVPIPIYGTIWILVLAYVTKFLPYASRTNIASAVQVHDELLEAGTTSGAGWLQVFRRILFPLLLPGLLGGWIYVFLMAFRELSTSSLLGNADNTVLVVMLLDLYEDGRFPAVGAIGVVMIIFNVALVALAARLGARVGVRNVT